MTSADEKNAGSKAWHLYVLRCGDGTFYTGITTDLSRRIIQHNDGTASRYTRGRLPVRLVYHEQCGDRSEALRKEYEIKQLPRKDKERYIKARN